MTELNDHSARAHALLSASSAHRWLACPSSAVAAEAYPNEETEYTKEGTLAHEVAEIIARRRVPELYSDIDMYEFPEGYTQEMILCAEAYADYIQEQIKDPAATVLLEERVDFSPWVPDGFGTADCIILQGDTMDVIDYKYGQGVPVSAVGNPQEKLYGLGALNDFGLAYDIKNVRLHIFQPRLDNTSVDSLTADELLAWGEKTVKPTAAKAYKGKGGYTPGDHCKFCPHAGRCRALTKVCTDYVESHGLRVAVPVLAPHEVAEALRMEPLVTLWLRRLKAQALTDLLNGQEVPGFKVVEGKPGNRKWTDELQVADVLKNAGYRLDEYTETKLLSPAGMDKLLGKKKAAELLAGYTDRAPGSPTVVPETDKRPVFDRVAEAVKDFE
jgi:hypothetical protein